MKVEIIKRCGLMPPEVEAYLYVPPAEPRDWFLLAEILFSGRDDYEIAGIVAQSRLATSDLSDKEFATQLADPEREIAWVVGEPGEPAIQLVPDRVRQLELLPCVVPDPQDLSETLT